jgi:uronate dehydrogenase
MGRILITGAAGGVGSFLVAGLPAMGWQVRGFDLRPGTQTDGVEWVTGDVRDADALDAAMVDVEAVVHLAGIPGEKAFPEILSVNIDGSYQLFEAARRAGIGRLVYASSNHAVGFTPRADLVGVDVRPRPDTFYGLSKVFGEGLASLYSDRYGMRVACIRIGSCFARPSRVRQLSTWLSPDDAVRLVHACLTAPDLTYAVVYGISANTRGWWDLEPARALGYRPRDDAERYAAEVLAEHGPLDDEDPEAKYLGGNFVIHESSPSH